MKVVFMGTPDLAVDSLEALAKEHNVALAVTQPDKPRGRGKKLIPTPVKQKAIELGIPTLEPASVKDADFIERLREYAPDIIVVVAFGQILPEEILNMPKYGCVNAHGSLLPKYRGAAPIQRAIMDGETETGVTVMYMEKGLDTGDMLLKESFAIEPNDTYGDVCDKMKAIAAKLLLKTLETAEKGELKPEKQNDALSTYAHTITKETVKIDWAKPASEIRNLIRGLNPAPKAQTVYENEVFKLLKAELTQGEGKAGEIIDITKKGFVAATGDGALLITELQAQGGKKMPAADYMRGHEIKKGVILG